jgi:hypothetical protein
LVFFSTTFSTIVTSSILTSILLRDKIWDRFNSNYKLTLGTENPCFFAISPFVMLVIPSKV